MSQNIPVGTVWNQVPAAGKSEPPNTVITLFVQADGGDADHAPVRLGHADRLGDLVADCHGHPDNHRDRHHAGAMKAGSRPYQP